MKIGETSSSSIEEVDIKIKELYDKIQDIHTSSSKNYFDIKHNIELDSYYEPLKHTGYADYSFIDLSNSENFKHYLDGFWSNVESLQFQSISASLSELAFILKESNQEEATELSPFIYVMF